MKKEFEFPELSIYSILVSDIVTASDNIEEVGSEPDVEVPLGEMNFLGEIL